jgi:hypothetical protein
MSARAADDETKTKIVSRTTIETEAPAIQSPWKASAVSNYKSGRGTKNAEFNAYSFGDVRIYTQTLGLDYTMRPDWALQMRAQYMNQEWSMDKSGVQTGQHSHGMGDTLIGATHTFLSNPEWQLMADAGAYLPTGSITVANEYSPSVHYGYRMQLGSGTFDPSLGVTSQFKQAYYVLGSRLTTIQRTGINNSGYRLGNVYRADAWADMPVRYGITPRLVGYYLNRNGIPSGQDKTITRAASGEFYYHDQIFWSMAAAVKYDQAIWKTIALNAEVGVPFIQGFQNKDGVEVSTYYYGNLSVSGQF